MESKPTNRAERRADAKAKSKSKAKGTGKGGGGFVSQKALDEHRQSSALGGPTAKHISAARAAAGRRNQAKRDGR